MCNTCGNSTCFGNCNSNCYPSVPNQWNTCSAPAVRYYPPVSCPAPTTGLNLLYARVVTINTEFFQMPVTPKTLILAPGAGKLIVPLQIWNSITVSTPAIPYTDITPASVTLLLNLGTTNLVTDLSILGSLTDQTVYYPNFSGSVPSTLANQPLTLSTISQPVVGSSQLFTYIVYTIVSI